MSSTMVAPSANTASGFVPDGKQPQPQQEQQINREYLIRFLMSMMRHHHKMIQVHEKNSVNIGYLNSYDLETDTFKVEVPGEGIVEISFSGVTKIHEFISCGGRCEL